MKVYILYLYDWECDVVCPMSIHRTKENAEQKIKEYKESLHKFIEIKEQELLLDNDCIFEFWYN